MKEYFIMVDNGTHHFRKQLPAFQVVGEYKIGDQHFFVYQTTSAKDVFLTHAETGLELLYPNKTRFGKDYFLSLSKEKQTARISELIYANERAYGITLVEVANRVQQFVERTSVVNNIVYGVI